MASIDSEPNLSNHYLVFGHGLRLINKGTDSNFPLDPNYRIITLHKPGEEIYNKLVKIITNSIEKKSSALGDLFLIKCPIARGKFKNNLENSFIRDYFVNIFLTHPEQLPSALDDILFVDPETVNFNTIDELNKYLDTLDYSDIKSQLNFEIRTYRPSDLCPKLLLDFNVQKSLSNLKGGVYKVSKFNGFNYREYDELQELGEISQSVSSEKIIPDVELSDKYQYVFDDVDGKLGLGTPFFDAIKSKIPSGLLIVLSCGKYSAKPNGLVRQASIEQQNAPYRKYYIKYN